MSADHDRHVLLRAPRQQPTYPRPARRDIVDEINEDARGVERYLEVLGQFRHHLPGGDDQVHVSARWGGAPAQSIALLALILMNAVTGVSAEAALRASLRDDDGSHATPDDEPAQDIPNHDTAGEPSTDTSTAASDPMNPQAFGLASPIEWTQPLRDLTLADGEREQIRSKRTADPLHPIKWSAQRPSLLSRQIFGSLPTREETYRLAIKEEGKNPDQKYFFTDHWQLFSQNVMTSTFKADQIKTHLEIALDADTNPLPFINRRTPADLYLPGEALFNAAYRQHIRHSKAVGDHLVHQELSKYGINHHTKVDFLTVNAYTTGSADPIAADRGYIFKVRNDNGIRYFVVTPLVDDMVFPVPKSEDLEHWIGRHKHLFFGPETDFSEIQSYSTRTKQHHIKLNLAIGYAVHPLVERILDGLKRIAYAETSLQEFIHMARGICDPTGIYDIKRALELEDYTTLSLNVGAAIFPAAREHGRTAIKFIARHTNWLKNFVKSKTWLAVGKQSIGAAARVAEGGVDPVVEQALNVRSILGLDHSDQSEPEQKKSFDRHDNHLSNAAATDLRAIGELISSDSWIRNNIVNQSNTNPLSAIAHMRDTLLEAGYKSGVICMLTWHSSRTAPSNRFPKMHYAVTARRFGDNQHFVVDAPIDSFDRFGIQGIQITSLQEWEKLIHDKARQRVPNGLVKYKIFSTFQEAQETFDPGAEIAPETDLGGGTIVLYGSSNPHKRRKPKYVVTARPRN